MQQWFHNQLFDPVQVHQKSTAHTIELVLQAQLVPDIGDTSTSELGEPGSCWWCARALRGMGTGVVKAAVLALVPASAAGAAL